MGRSALIVREGELQATVTALEVKQEFSNIGELCKAVSESDYGRGIKNSRMQVKGISPAKVYQCLNEFKISFKTKAGRRGRVAGSTVNRTSRSDKLAGNKLVENWKCGMNKVVNLPEVPDRFAKVVDRVASGSFRAGVMLACANCHGFEGSTYKSCASTTCPILPLNVLLWPQRGKGPETNEGGFGFDSSEIKE
jgi:hypothetical protein